MPSSHEITLLLLAWSEGDQAALEQLVPLIHVSPRTVRREWSLARAWLRRELRRREPGGGDEA